MKKESNFEIVSITKSVTERGSNCFELEVVDKKSGEHKVCTYFGNTTPKTVTEVTEYVSKKTGEVYLVASIQPHTSRDKKTGRFISAYRA